MVTGQRNDPYRSCNFMVEIDGVGVVNIGGLPLGLAHGVKVVRPVAKGQSLCWDDVAMDQGSAAYRVRREMEAMFST